MSLSPQQKSGFPIFSSIEFKDENLLFSDKSTSFIPAEHEDYIAWMGREYYNILKAMDCNG